MAPLNAEEQALLNFVELAEWQSVPNVTEEVVRYQRYAQAQVNAVIVAPEAASSSLDDEPQLEDLGGSEP